MHSNYCSLQHDLDSPNVDENIGHLHACMQLEKEGYDRDSSTIHRAGKKLADKGLVKREEWTQRVHYDVSDSKVKRYKYFPADQDKTKHELDDF